MVREKEHSHADNVEKTDSGHSLGSIPVTSPEYSKLSGNRGLHLNDEHRYLEYKRGGLLQSEAQSGI